MQNLFVSLLTVFTMAIHADSWKTSLPVVLYGMLGIFIVIGVIVLVTYLLNKLTSKKKDNSDE
ncbi:hypothetical protein [uncultured Eubacterium sp.]|uniref:hypothetical protein n=1 Tax=uncultured Eubacterium sp. TaxID=165185 RepID=UPI00262B574F|nr:hypothetical protein [uncultured Eubacterium sp.]